MYTHDQEYIQKHHAVIRNQNHLNEAENPDPENILWAMRVFEF
jgi:hypothetical protein